MYVGSINNNFVVRSIGNGMEFSIDNGETWKPFGYVVDNDIMDSVRYATESVDSTMVIHNTSKQYKQEDHLRDFKEEKIMEILEIYKVRKMKAIDQEFEEKRESLENNNEIINRYKEIINTFQADMDEFVNEEKVKASGFIEQTPYFDNYRYELNRPKISELFDDINKERTDKFQELDRLIDEAKAMIDIVPKDGNYDAKVVEILKRYDILDKKGKINA